MSCHWHQALAGSRKCEGEGARGEYPSGTSPEEEKGRYAGGCVISGAESALTLAVPPVPPQSPLLRGKARPLWERRGGTFEAGGMFKHGTRQAIAGEADRAFPRGVRERRDADTAHHANIATIAPVSIHSGRATPRGRGLGAEPPARRELEGVPPPKYDTARAAVLRSSKGEVPEGYSPLASSIYSRRRSSRRA